MEFSIIKKTNDLENGITIKRQNTIQTISTTQVIISDEIILKHQDRLNTHSKPEKILLKNEFKTVFYKIVHWEYWLSIPFICHFSRFYCIVHSKQEHFVFHRNKSIHKNMAEWQWKAKKKFMI